MTKVKFCGLSRLLDIKIANELRPDYIGFVFSPKSKRYIIPSDAFALKKSLHPSITAVGVFVNAPIESVASLLNNGTIEIAQLHGDEDESYIKQLRQYSDKPIIKAFQMRPDTPLALINHCTAEYVLLDSGTGSGTPFNWNLIKPLSRPYFLAGGLHKDNLGTALKILHPFAVDVSSGIETNGLKDQIKMAEFIAAVRKENT